MPGGCAEPPISVVWVFLTWEAVQKRVSGRLVGFAYVNETRPATPSLPPAAAPP
jgi:hypothetical protein